MGTKRLPSPPKNPGVRELIRGKRQWTQPLPETARQAGFLGWHERGYLPHRDEPGLVQFVSYRLNDAFSADHRAEWEGLLDITDPTEKHRQLEAYVDRGRGVCHLAEARVATMIRPQ